MLFNRQIGELTKGKWQKAEGGAISAEFQVAGVINSALHSFRVAGGSLGWRVAGGGWRG